MEDGVDYYCSGCTKDHMLCECEDASASDSNDVLCDKVQEIFHRYLTKQAKDPAGKCNGGCRCVLDKLVIDEVMAAIKDAHEV